MLGVWWGCHGTPVGCRKVGTLESSPFGLVLHGKPKLWAR